MTVDDIKRHGRQTREAQRTGYCRHYIDNPAGHEWSACQCSNLYPAGSKNPSDHDGDTSKFENARSSNQIRCDARKAELTDALRNTVRQ